MAGDWLKVEVETPEKPEVFAIAAFLGWADPDLAFAKLYKIWRWFDRHTLDGNAVGVSLALLDHVVGVSGFAQAMKNVGWLVESGAGVILPNFDHHNGKTAKTRALTARRVKNHAEKGEKTNAPTVSSPLAGALPKEDKREESVIGTQRPHETPGLEDVQKYARSAPVPISEACAVAFFDTQEASGWITRHGHSIADWRAALRRYASNWNENEKSKTKPAKPHRQGEFPEPEMQLPDLPDA